MTNPTAATTGPMITAVEATAIRDQLAAFGWGPRRGETPLERADRRAGPVIVKMVGKNAATIIGMGLDIWRTGDAGVPPWKVCRTGDAPETAAAVAYGVTAADAARAACDVTRVEIR